MIKTRISGFMKGYLIKNSNGLITGLLKGDYYRSFSLPLSLSISLSFSTSPFLLQENGKKSAEIVCQL